jgi:hypothetical protein
MELEVLRFLLVPRVALLLLLLLVLLVVLWLLLLVLQLRRPAVQLLKGQWQQVLLPVLGPERQPLG